MTTGLTYATYQTQVAELAIVQSTSDTNFQAILPAMIDYAELRIIRDLDLLSTVSSSTALLSISTRQVSLPGFVTVQQINVITPAGTTNPDIGTRNPLTPTTKEVLDMLWRDVSSAAQPTRFAPFNQSTGGGVQTQNTFLVGPFPDSTYTIEVIGTQRPASLSATTTQTFISQNLPDLMIMASMVYISAYQRNFSGMASNDPNMPISYEEQYQTLLKGAGVEEARKKFQAAAWSSMSPAPAATPTRG